MMNRGHPMRIALWLAVGCCAWNGCKSDGVGPFHSLFLGGEDKEECTIQLYRFTGPDHARQVAQAKRAAEELAQWKGVFVLHEDNASTLYWGRYPSKKAARPDLQTAKNWQTPAELRPFQFAILMPYPSENPGNPDWDLRRATGAYTVVVEVYFDDPERKFKGRKQVAAQRCDELRKQGVEAYYCHGAARSSVTIGLFDESAVNTVRDGAVARQVVTSREMQEILRKRPYLFVNGKKTEIGVPDMKTGKGQWVFRPTYPVQVPGSKGGERPDAMSGFGDT
ncbi:MAG TPA: hypothetical protein VM389_06010 [Phycisphaerae bacterium]|nr:hypothetical protein [Phycisphaerae bacterium]